MKRVVLAGVLSACLLIPGQALATGSHGPQTPPQGPCKGNQQVDPRTGECPTGTAGPVPKPCLCCEQIPDIINQITQQKQVIESLRQLVVRLDARVTQLEQRVTVIENTPDPLRCESGRVYRFRVRTDVGGVRVTGVDRVLVRGSERYGSVRRVNGRFQVTADYRGVKAPSGQLRSVTVFVRLADGRQVRTVQKLRLCLENDGNLNDTSAQDRARR